MFENIGKKIKVLAKVIFAISLISAIIGGIVLISTDDDLLATGLFVLLAGPVLIGLIPAWMIYGFGELVDKTCDIAAGNRPVVGGAPVYSNPNAPAAPVVSKAKAAEMNKRIAQIEDLRSKGLITEEEYLLAVSKVQ